MMEEYIRLLDEVIYCRRVCRISGCKRCEEILLLIDKLEKEQEEEKDVQEE